MSSSSSLKKLLKNIPPDEELRAISRRLMDYSDEATALVACSLLSHALRDAIASKFIGLTKKEMEGIFSDNQGGPLSNFSSRIRIAHALGIVGPRTRDDLNVLRGIRNAIAHAVPKVDFASKEVHAECAKIKFVNDADTAPAKELYVLTAGSIARNLQFMADQGLAKMTYPVKLP